MRILQQLAKASIELELILIHHMYVKRYPAFIRDSPIFWRQVNPKRGLLLARRHNCAHQPSPNLSTRASVQ